MLGVIYFYNAYSQVTANVNTNIESVSNQIYLNKVYIKSRNLYNNIIMHIHSIYSYFSTPRVVRNKKTPIRSVQVELYLLHLLGYVISTSIALFSTPYRCTSTLIV